jgi:hypothetical protein
MNDLTHSPPRAIEAVQENRMEPVSDPIPDIELYPPPAECIVEINGKRYRRVVVSHDPPYNHGASSYYVPAE